MIYKVKGLRVANYIVEEVIAYCTGWEVPVDGWVEAFNNCREQGYIINVFHNQTNLGIYVYCNRHTDMPSFTYDIGFMDKIYSEDAYYNRTFSFDTADDTVNAITELIETFVKGELKNGK